ISRSLFCPSVLLPFHLFFFSFLMLPPPPRSTLFPYTTLFRSMRGLCGTRFVSVTVGRKVRCSRDSAVQPTVRSPVGGVAAAAHLDRKSTRLNSSHDQISYAVFCLKKKKIQS